MEDLQDQVVLEEMQEAKGLTEKVEEVVAILAAMEDVELLVIVVNPENEDKYIITAGTKYRK